jgi:hypothetical protein
LHHYEWAATHRCIVGWRRTRNGAEKPSFNRRCQRRQRVVGLFDRGCTGFRWACQRRLLCDRAPRFLGKRNHPVMCRGCSGTRRSRRYWFFKARQRRVKSCSTRKYEPFQPSADFGILAHSNGIHLQFNIIVITRPFVPMFASTLCPHS